MVRDIYLAEIMFTDESRIKIRPILLIQENSFRDYVFLPLTSNLNAKGITIDNPNIESGYLPKQSVVIIEKISVISPALLIKRIATLNEITYQKILAELRKFLSNS